MDLRIERLTATAILPSYAHAGDAGMDLSADESVTLAPFARYAVSTGLKMQLPSGTEGQIRPRSGLALKHGITVLNAPGTIDEGYRGELKILLINLSDTPFEIERGMRIAQLIVAPIHRCSVTECKVADVTERATGGFGSSGV